MDFAAVNCGFWWKPQIFCPKIQIFFQNLWFFMKTADFDENCGFQLKTTDFLLKSMVFTKNCRFQKKINRFWWILQLKTTDFDENSGFSVQKPRFSSKICSCSWKLWISAKNCRFSSEIHSFQKKICSFWLKTGFWPKTADFAVSVCVF